MVPVLARICALVGVKAAIDNMGTNAIGVVWVRALRKNRNNRTCIYREKEIYYKERDPVIMKAGESKIFFPVSGEPPLFLHQPMLLLLGCHKTPWGSGWGNASETCKLGAFLGGGLLGGPLACQVHERGPYFTVGHASPPLGSVCLLLPLSAPKDLLFASHTDELPSYFSPRLIPNQKWEADRAASDAWLPSTYPSQRRKCSLLGLIWHCSIISLSYKRKEIGLLMETSGLMCLY